MSEIHTAFQFSPSIGNFSAAMATAQAVMGNAVKDSTNPHFKSKYADLASVRTAVAPLSEVGIAFMQFPSTQGKIVTVTTLLAHKSGEWVTCSVSAEARAADPQSIGSAITYLRRYGLLAAAGLATDDDDGEAAVRPERREPTPTPKPPVNPMDAFEANCRAHGLTLPQIDTWRATQGKGGVMSLSIPELVQFDAWLFAPQRAATRLAIKGGQ